MLVQSFLEQSAEASPEKTALVCDGKRLTYREVDESANRLANALLFGGLQRGQRVAIHLPNCIEAVIGIFAALKAGGVFVMLNPTTRYAKSACILRDCQASALIAGGQPADYYANTPRDLTSLTMRIYVSRPGQPDRAPDGWVAYRDIQATQSNHRPSNRCIDVDLACLVYTSGSIGEPKGVMSDHSNVDFVSSSIISYLQNRAEDVVIDFMPLAFDYGLYQLLMVFKFGGTLVLEKSFAFPAAILQRIQNERVTGFPGVPTSYALILQMDLSSYDLSSLRYLTNTAAALPPSHIRQLREKFPWVTIYSMYGLTETKRTLYMPPDWLDGHLASVGIAIPGTEVWLEDEQGNRLGANQVGELVVRGRHVMRGYWNDPQATAERFRPGPLPNERLCYTGDLFRMDEEGFFYFVSRKDDIIKCRGEKVAPIELERVLYEIPGVLEAAAIGVPDEVMGQAIKVFVVRSDPRLDRMAILAYFRNRVEDYLMPKYVEFCAELPRTDSGKVIKSSLK